MIDRIIGQYRIINKLGEGGMGEVWLAEDIRLERRVALKLLPHHAAQLEEEKARFIQEAKTAARLNHPNIAQVHEIGEEEGRLFIVMEYVESGSLSDQLKEAKGRSLPLEQVLNWIQQAAEGLAEAHRQGVVHRDIKPDNLMLTHTGHIKITDFGLARLETATRLTASGATLGTINYMSPEQVVGGDIDRRADLFSLGATFYELLTGYRPFEGSDATAIYYSILHEEPDPVYRYRRGIDPALDQIVSKLLQKDPQLRYQYADEVVADLRRLTGGPGRPERPVRTRRHRGGGLLGVVKDRLGSTAGVVVGFLLAVAVGSIWYFGFGPGSRSQEPAGTEPQAIERAEPSTAAEASLAPSTDPNTELLQAFVSYVGEMSQLNRRVDSLQTLLVNERSASVARQAEPGRVDEAVVSPEIVRIQAQYDSLLSLLTAGGTTQRAGPSPGEKEEDAGQIRVLSPLPESITHENKLDVSIAINPRRRVEKLYISMDGEIQVYRPTNIDEEDEVIEQIDLGTAGRHLIGVSIEDDAGNRSEKQLYVVFIPAVEEALIGVLDLAADNVDPGEVRAITDRLRYALGRQGVYKVIPRVQMEAIFAEVGFQMSGACDTDEVVVQVGRVLGVTKMVAGSVVRTRSVYSLQARLIDIESSAVENRSSSDEEGIEAVLTEATEKVAQELIGITQSAERTAEPQPQQPVEEPQREQITGPLTVGVLDLDANNVDAGEARAITERLRLFLARQDVFSVIERNQMDNILNEVGFVATGACNTDQCVIQIGQILGAQKMVVGSVSRVGTLYSLQARILDVGQSKIDGQAFRDVTGGMGEVLTEATLYIAQDLAKYYIPE